MYTIDLISYFSCSETIGYLSSEFETFSLGNVVLSTIYPIDDAFAFAIDSVVKEFMAVGHNMLLYFPLGRMQSIYFYGVASKGSDAVVMHIVDSNRKFSSIMLSRTELDSQRNS